MCILINQRNRSFVATGVGGQIDFIRGAALGLDGQGKPILAMPSTTAKGASKIVPYIHEGKAYSNDRLSVKL